MTEPAWKIHVHVPIRKGDHPPEMHEPYTEDQPRRVSFFATFEGRHVHHGIELPAVWTEEQVYAAGATTLSLLNRCCSGLITARHLGFQIFSGRDLLVFYRV
jgi:hypothetical protein